MTVGLHAMLPQTVHYHKCPRLPSFGGKMGAELFARISIACLPEISISFALK